jgi:hypothetical protein
MKRFSDEERAIIETWTGTPADLAAKLGRDMRAIARFKNRNGIPSSRREITPGTVEEIRRLRSKGLTVSAISTMLNISITSAVKYSEGVK